MEVQCQRDGEQQSGHQEAGGIPESRRRRLLRKEDSFCSGTDQPKEAATIGKGHLGQPRTTPLQLRPGPPLYMLQAYVGKAFPGIPNPLLILANSERLLSYKTWMLLKFSLRHAEPSKHAHFSVPRSQHSQQEPCPNPLCDG